MRDGIHPETGEVGFVRPPGPYRVLDENAWGLLRIHDDDGDDGGGDDDDDVLAEGVSSHFVCTATHRRKYTLSRLSTG